MSSFSVLVAGTKIAGLGPWALLSKMDIHQVYRNIPVASEDKPLLGLQLNNQIYINQVLTIGLCLVPMIFSIIDDILLWIMSMKGVSK